MPKKKEPMEEQPEAVVTVLDDDSDLERVLSEVGSSAKYIAVSRYDTAMKKWAYVEKIPIEDFDLESIKTEYGGGNYRGRVYGEAGYIRHISFTIDSRFLPRPVLPPTVTGISNSPPDSSLSEIKDLLRQMILVQSQPKSDPMDMAIRLAEVLRGGASVAAPSTPALGFAEMFSIFKEGMSIGQSASGSGEGLSYLPVIEKVGMPLIEAIKTMANRPPQTPVLNKANGGPPLKPPTPQTPEQYLQFALPQILGLAVAKKDPMLYADVILDQVPETAYDYLLSVAERPDAISYLSSLHHGVKEHEAWFLTLIGAIKEALTPESESAPTMADLDLTKLGAGLQDGSETDE